MPRPIALVLGLAIVFGVTVLLLNQILPGPRKPTDYLVMGGVATMLCLVLAFLLLAVMPRKSDREVERGKTTSKHKS